jgi:flavodoxin
MLFFGRAITRWRTRARRRVLRRPVRPPRVSTALRLLALVRRQIAAPSVPPVVAFGSSHGGSERAAKPIASSLGITAVALNSLLLATPAHSEFAAIVISTIGNGNYPKNAEKFCQELEHSDIYLRGFRFGVPALGSSVDTYFWRSGELLTKMLTERGGSPSCRMCGWTRLRRDREVHVRHDGEGKRDPVQRCRPPVDHFRTVPITHRELLSVPGVSSPMSSHGRSTNSPSSSPSRRSSRTRTRSRRSAPASHTSLLFGSC